MILSRSVGQDGHGTSNATMPATKAGKHALHSQTHHASPEKLLSGIRGVLILWVMWNHFMDFERHMVFNVRSAINTCIFVILSGFSLQLAYLEAKGRVSWPSYFRPKAVGLFPVYYLAILLELLWYISIHKRHTFVTAGYRDDSIQYLWDFLLNLTAEQGWVQEVLVRSFPSLYYASIQWNLYLFLFLHVTVIGPLIKRLLSVSFGHRSFITYLGLVVTSILLINLEEKVIPIRPSYPQLLMYMYPYFLLGTAVAGLYHAILHKSSAAGIRVDAFTAHGRPIQQIVINMLWRVGALLLLAVLIWLIVDTKNVPHPPSSIDHYLRFAVTSLLVVMLLLLLAFQPCKSLLKMALESELLVTIGSVSFAIYLFHSAIAMYYFPMAVKGWGGILAPPSESNTDLCFGVWLRSQGVFFKVIVMASCIVFSWLMQRFIVDKFLLSWAANILSGEWLPVLPSKKQKRDKSSDDIEDSKQECPYSAA